MEKLKGLEEVVKPTGPYVGLVGKSAINTISIDPTAVIEQGTNINPGVIVEEGVRIGEDVTLAPGVRVGYGSTLDNGSIVQPGVYVPPYSRVELGQTVRS